MLRHRDKGPALVIVTMPTPWSRTWGGRKWLRSISMPKPTGVQQHQYWCFPTFPFDFRGTSRVLREFH